MVNAVLFGAGLIFVLPGLSADAGFWISVVVGASLILAAPIAWWIAPRLCAHFGNRRAEGTQPPDRCRRLVGASSVVNHSHELAGDVGSWHEADRWVRRAKVGN
jgi:hypothetical protein